MIFQSFSLASLKKAAALVPEVPRIALWRGDSDLAGARAWIDQARSVDVVAVGVPQTSVTARLAVYAHQHGLLLYPYVVNHDVDFWTLSMAGVDGFYSNTADRVLWVFGRFPKLASPFANDSTDDLLAADPNDGGR